jgi:hypothetical protein
LRVHLSGSGQARYPLGEGLVDRFLEFVAGRCQPNTPRAIAFDRQALVAVVGKDPVAVTAADVFDFLADQRGNRTVSCSGPRGHQVPARPLGADFGAPPRPSLHRRGRSDAVSTRRQLEVGEAGVDEYGVVAAQVQRRSRRCW